MSNKRNPADYISEKINDDLTLTNCVRTYVDKATGEIKPHRDFGWWLYDKNFGINLSMRAKTEKEALIEALVYYNKRYKQKAEEFNSLSGKVSGFLAQFSEEEEDW